MECKNNGCNKEAVGEGTECADCINNDYDTRMTKNCKVCKEEKPKTEFYDRQLTCKKCRSNKNKEKYQKLIVLTVECTTEVDLFLPTVPKLIRTKSGAVLNIADLDDETLKAIGAEWTKQLLAQAKKKRGG